MKILKIFLVLVASLLLLNTTTFSQEKAIEKMPEPIGGIGGIAENLKYPDAAKKENIQGKVVIKALIDETGQVVKTEVIKSLHPSCDLAAKAAIKKTKFTPGENKGKKVKAEVVIPVMFKLNDKKEK